MKQRLHIHFGIHRTGTSSIHHHLYRNLSALKEIGICYPNMDVGHRHVKLVWKLVSKKISPGRLFQKLKKEVPEDAKLIILSSEDFSLMRNLDWLKAASSEYELSASVYLKRQDSWLESWYNQNIRWPWDKRLSKATPEIFLKHVDEFHWINFDVLLKKISTVIPREKLYVNVIDSSGIRDTVEDFFRHCEINTTLAPPKIENESISAAKLDILRRINLFDVEHDMVRRKIISAVRRLNIDEDDGSKTVFNDEQVRLILDKFKLSNQVVATNYFGREELFLDSVKWNRTPCFVSDLKAYRIYIPQLVKNMAMYEDNS